MNNAHKTPKNAGDKNTRRVEKQTETEQQVKTGMPSKTSASVRSGLMIRASGNDDGNMYQTGGPGRPMFAVDPELERQMAAQGVAQDAHTGKALQKKNLKPQTKMAKVNHSTGKRQSTKSSKEIPDAGAWDGKGNPGFAAPGENQPGPL